MKWEKWYLKLTDWEQYKNYKYSEKLSKLNPSLFEHPQRQVVSFKHSGNAGDIIYALPAVFALANGNPIELKLKIGTPVNWGKRYHPIGKVLFNQQMYDLLKPLLNHQPGIKCSVFEESTPVDFDLDLIRTYPFPLNRGHICRWYFHAFGVNADLTKPWLQVKAATGYSDKIIINRSHRYNAPGIDYSFLERYENLVFVGLEQEYQTLKSKIPGLEYQAVTDFLQLAQIIAGSKLFIGNQSFAFSIAEALKVPRILEVYHQTPNVIVEGPNGYDFCYQPHFEKLVSQLS